MSKKSEVVSQEEVKVGEVKVGEVKVVEEQGEETLPVDVHFTDEHLSRIAEAGFEPASVRNEFGLVKVAREPQITLTEAIKRAKERYGKK